MVPVVAEEGEVSCPPQETLNRLVRYLPPEVFDATLLDVANTTQHCTYRHHFHARA